MSPSENLPIEVERDYEFPNVETKKKVLQLDEDSEITRRRNCAVLVCHGDNESTRQKWGRDSGQLTNGTRARYEPRRTPCSRSVGLLSIRYVTCQAQNALCRRAACFQILGVTPYPSLSATKSGLDLYKMHPVSLAHNQSPRSTGLFSVSMQIRWSNV